MNMSTQKDEVKIFLDTLKEFLRTNPRIDTKEMASNTHQELMKLRKQLDECQTILKERLTKKRENMH